MTSKKKSNDDIFLTAAELSARWRNEISVRTLGNWRTKKFGPKPTRIGARVVYRLTDVELYERDEAKRHPLEGRVPNMDRSGRNAPD